MGITGKIGFVLFLWLCGCSLCCESQVNSIHVVASSHKNQSMCLVNYQAFGLDTLATFSTDSLGEAYIEFSYKGMILFKRDEVSSFPMFLSEDEDNVIISDNGIPSFTNHSVSCQLNSAINTRRELIRDYVMSLGVDGGLRKASGRDESLIQYFKHGTFHNELIDVIPDGLTEMTQIYYWGYLLTDKLMDFNSQQECLNYRRVCREYLKEQVSVIKNTDIISRMALLFILIDGRMAGNRTQFICYTRDTVDFWLELLGESQKEQIIQFYDRCVYLSGYHDVSLVGILAG